MQYALAHITVVGRLYSGTSMPMRGVCFAVAPRSGGWAGGRRC